jgi:Zn-dependent alcohol dehydrogenase
MNPGQMTGLSRLSLFWNHISASFRDCDDLPAENGLAWRRNRLSLAPQISLANMGSNHFSIDMPRYSDYYQQGGLSLDAISGRGELEGVYLAFRAIQTGEVASPF